MHLKDKNLYGNCQVLHPDGFLMFLCSPKKANWYLVRNLAKWIKKNPPIIQLTFTPNGKGHVNEPFYLNERKNECVVCGSTKKLTKHHCVPKCYRAYFPEHLKSSSCHDVLLLCELCHRKYEAKAFDLKKELAVKYNVTVDDYKSLSNFKYSEEERRQLQAIGIAKTLLSNIQKIPHERKQYLLAEIKNVFGSLSLEEVANYKIEKREVAPHGKSIVENIENIYEFTCMWRKHFVETMQPKFLVKEWDVNYNVERRNETIY